MFEHFVCAQLIFSANEKDKRMNLEGLRIYKMFEAGK